MLFESCRQALGPAIMLASVPTDKAYRPGWAGIFGLGQRMDGFSGRDSVPHLVEAVAAKLQPR